MGDGNRGRELGRVLNTYAAALSRLAASYESRSALREELLQDIAFALWRALPSFRGEASEKTFVLRIATNRALSHLAARRAEKGMHLLENGCAPLASPLRSPTRRRDRTSSQRGCRTHPGCSAR